MMKGQENQATNALMATVLGSYGATETVQVDEEEPVLVEGDSVATSGSSPQCRDIPFALLFWAHALVMIWLGMYVAPSGYENIHIDFSQVKEELRKDEDITDENIIQFEEFLAETGEYLSIYPVRIALYLVLPCCTLAFIVAFITMAGVVKRFPRTIVYSSLVGSLILTSVVMVCSALGARSFLGAALSGLVLFAVMYYVSIAWRLVPFAAVNLKGALKGMSRNCGIYFVAFLSAELGFIWLAFWAFTLVGVASEMNSECRLAHPESDFSLNSDNYDGVCDPPPMVCLFFLVSVYWTSTVVMNTIQVTVAGAMATWCFDKREADSCCSSAVYASLFRSLTYSFGSICLGSLLQAIVTVFRYILDGARAERDRDNSECGGICLCILDCLVRWLEDILEYFNQFAYIYVGIYGFSYLESGRRVLELFRARGWSTIVSDNLVGFVLATITVSVAVMTGLIAVAIELGVSSRFHDENTEVGSYLGMNKVATFSTGLVIGLWVSSVMTKVVRGAVNTLIVCFADSPAVFESEHPAFTNEMADAWISVFHEHSLHIRSPALQHRPVLA